MQALEFEEGKYKPPSYNTFNNPTITTPTREPYSSYGSVKVYFHDPGFINQVVLYTQDPVVFESHSSTESYSYTTGSSSYPTESYSSTTADDPSKSANANAEHHDGPSRNFGDVNGKYSEQDNRKIDRNIEKCGIYCEYTGSDWKTFVAGGGMATTAFYAGHMTARGRVEGPSTRTKNAIANVYPQHTFYQVPPVVVSLVVLPVALINLLSSFRRVLTAFASHD
ncbi:hypothetical protein K435DRAFT_846622 [Dendrothele bispora CBS 962.96]|uniref:Uncharacterized protein n=1 Tax=Dendrothele bispora (strain CBS 962.96) TaxID=1314807 RepID=A0A4S8KLI8_DENBC|nr:hypothetical protein K435DRAFT_846737 [Dendrothele bispora CBS 962.96]THU76367.1 hypothetical protein K435DRAFT_846622 [Dendrothele bispora CBS 962.96]